jgi:hypothetical protein
MQKIDVRKLEKWLENQLWHYQKKGGLLSDIERGQMEALEVVQDAFENGEFDEKCNKVS